MILAALTATLWAGFTDDENTGEPLTPEEKAQVVAAADLIRNVGLRTLNSEYVRIGNDIKERMLGDPPLICKESDSDAESDLGVTNAGPTKAEGRVNLYAKAFASKSVLAGTLVHEYGPSATPTPCCRGTTGSRPKPTPASTGGSTTSSRRW